jgi:hypothetical protein
MNYYRHLDERQIQIGLNIELKWVKSVTFFRVPTINVPVNTKVKKLNNWEGISKQKTIGDRNCGFRIMPDSIIINTVKCANPWSNIQIYSINRKLFSNNKYDFHIILHVNIANSKDEQCFLTIPWIISLNFDFFFNLRSLIIYFQSKIQSYEWKLKQFFHGQNQTFQTSTYKHFKIKTKLYW